MPLRYHRFWLLAALMGALGPASTVAGASLGLPRLLTYAGSYSGTGEISGSPPHAVRCRLSLQPASDKLTYVGRCSTMGASIGISGIITVDKGHLVAAMAATGGAAVLVRGVPHSGGVAFTSTARNLAGGHDSTISSTMTLAGGTITVDFSVLDNETGETARGSIPFVRLNR